MQKKEKKQRKKAKNRENKFTMLRVNKRINLEDYLKLSYKIHQSLNHEIADSHKVFKQKIQFFILIILKEIDLNLLPIHQVLLIKITNQDNMLYNK